MSAPSVDVPSGDPEVDLGDDVRLFGHYLLVERGSVVTAWRTWDILDPERAANGPWPPGWGHGGERRRVRSGHELWLKRRAGALSWFPGKPERRTDGSFDDSSNINGGVIYKVVVSAPHRRKGLATAMLTFARDLHPDRHIRHSGALSADGAAWAAAVP